MNTFVFEQVLSDINKFNHAIKEGINKDKEYNANELLNAFSKLRYLFVLATTSYNFKTNNLEGKHCLNNFQYNQYNFYIIHYINQLLYNYNYFLAINNNLLTSNKYLLDQISSIFETLEESLNLNNFFIKDIATKVKSLSKILYYIL